LAVDRLRLPSAISARSSPVEIPTPGRSSMGDFGCHAAGTLHPVLQPQ
jgi:hypothetical protein